MNISLVLTARSDLKVRLTWLNMRRLRLVRWVENAPRVAFVALAPEPVFVAFPLRHTPPPIWSGVEMHPGEIVLYAHGHHIYQRTSGAGRWGLISLSPRDLADFSKALTHSMQSRLPAARILKPPSKVVANLLRLHSRACRLAETKPDMIAHREVARALEEELLYALVNCLTGVKAHLEVAPVQRNTKIMARFEKVLASRDGAPRSMPEIAAIIGVSERTLRTCCEAFLGMNPSQYARLRRLNLVRTALRRADPATASVGAIATQHGISELGRFALAYRTLFGETPSATLQNVRSRSNLHSARQNLSDNVRWTMSQEGDEPRDT